MYRTSRNGLKFIRKHEGIRLEAYKCDAGVWTIGIGHTKGVKEGMKITDKQAMKFLEQDVKFSEDIVNKYFKGKKLYQEQFDALVSLCFNLGPGSITRSKLGRRILRNDDLELVAKEWIEFCHIGRTTARGLLRRRVEEIAMFLSYNRGI